MYLSLRASFLIRLCIVLFFGALVSAYIAATIGLFEIPDSFFYLNIGNFLLHKGYTSFEPFNVIKPYTLFSPLYGLFTSYIANMDYPTGAFFIPFIQIFILFLSSVIIYAIIKSHLSRKSAVPGAILFLLLPFNLIYATTMMSESISTFLFTLFAGILSDIFGKKRLPSSLLVLTACLLALARNAYVLLIPFSIGIWFFRERVFLKQETKPVFIIVRQIPALLGILCVGWWVSFNHYHHGVWNLTINTGRHLYNNVVHDARLLPPNDSIVLQTFRKHVPSESTLYDFEYVVQRYFTPDFKQGLLTEVQIDKLFLTFSLEAIKAHPTRWAQNVVKIAWTNVNMPPYSKGILTRLGFANPNCPTCTVDPCRFTWFRKLCSPLVNNSSANYLWTQWVLINLSYYPYISTLLFFLGLIGFVHAVINKKIIMVVMGSIFTICLLTVSIMQHPEGRYIFPTYPLYTILIVAGSRIVVQIFQKIKNRIFR